MYCAIKVCPLNKAHINSLHTCIPMQLFKLDFANSNPLTSGLAKICWDAGTWLAGVEFNAPLDTIIGHFGGGLHSQSLD